MAPQVLAESAAGEYRKPVASDSTCPRVMPAMERARGCARVRITCVDGTRTRLAGLYQEGCLKVRLPRAAHPDDTDMVLINTAGGLAGGDELSTTLQVGRQARVTVTTPACERVYRALAGEAFVHQTLEVEAGGRLDWLPQETIFFNGARFRRRVDVVLQEDAELTLSESLIFGRTAMGEEVRSGSLSDFWSIRRGRDLIFADAMRISEPFYRAVAGRGTLGEHRAVATVVHVGRQLNTKRDAIREDCSNLAGAFAGASVVGDVLVTRIAAPSGNVLRTALVSALRHVRDGRPMPRNWFC